MSISVGSAQEVFDAIEAGIASDPSTVSKVGGVFHFKVGDKSWTVDLKNGAGSVKQGPPSGAADCTVIAKEEDFINLMTGKVAGQKLFMEGKIKIQGNMGLVMKLDKIPKKAPEPKSSSTPAPSSAPSSGSTSGYRCTAVFEDLTKRITANPDLVSQVGGIYQFDITKGTNKPLSWTVDLKSGKGAITQAPAPKPDCTLTVSDDDFVSLMTGKANAQQLFTQGKLKIKGNMGIAMKLNKLTQAKASL